MNLMLTRVTKIIIFGWSAPLIFLPRHTGGRHICACLFHVRDGVWGQQLQMYGIKTAFFSSNNTLLCYYKTTRSTLYSLSPRDGRCPSQSQMLAVPHTVHYQIQSCIINSWDIISTQTWDLKLRLHFFPLQLSFVFSRHYFCMSFTLSFCIKGF